MAHLTYIVLLFMLASGSLYFRKPTSQQLQVYIVLVDTTYAKGSTTYMEVLDQVLDRGRKASDSLIYSYKESFTGFAARLTDKERKKLEGIEGILNVEQSINYELLTTRSWDFLGFPVDVNRAPGNAESDVIIGVIDTGIWPDPDSFSGDGLGPPPPRWKGFCQDIQCNNKIIGAQRYYSGPDTLQEPYSVLDTTGHGTHVSSIAAGSVVGTSGFFGLGHGTARGGVPSARIAVYKVCWTVSGGSTSCPAQDILKAMDDAMSDGVDLLSVSLSAGTTSYLQDILAMGAFRALRKGILMVAGAGNAGPGPSSVHNGAPWVLTVAASTTDRKFVADLELGNGQILTGENINTFEHQLDLYNLVNAQNLRNGSAMANQNDVNVITVYSAANVDAVSKTNPKGVIATGDICPFSSPSFPLPGVCLTSSDAAQVQRYVAGTAQPTGKIYKGRDILDRAAPVIARFSSRGPNRLSIDILKPDISAPGFNILAAWPPNVRPTGYSTDRRFTPFNIISGTSMACPHVSAIAVYVKSFHPAWSPSAIKSAIMTTATAMSALTNPFAEFEYGSGQVNPIQALEPGLVYDATDTDYIKFLCAEGYTEPEVRYISGDSTATCTGTHGFTTRDLNYPSISAKVVENLPFSITFRRTVTHVEPTGSVYTAHVINNPSAAIQVRVEPNTLSFSYEGQKGDFTVTVSGNLAFNTGVSSSLVWTNGRREVRSPILIYAGTW